MPVREVTNTSGKTIGYRWGETGKLYRNREDAEKQGRAIRASGYEEKNNEGKKKGNDGKACWDGYRYQKSTDGKDRCVKVNR